ncbi:MAG TPA: serine/threonine-protein kinase [Phycisphaerae bacterium]
MNSQRWRQVDELFQSALASPAAERERLLAHRCLDDSELRAEVESLLAAHARASSFIEAPAFTVSSQESGLDARPRHSLEGVEAGGVPALRAAIPGYEIVREISRGGQGVIYLALQKSTRRKVAIKVLLEGPYASPALRRRFEREIELAAQFKHPNIVAVYHSGTTADGRPFLAMDYVRGVPLHDYAREKKLGLEAALELFAQVCDAVQYAHLRGIIHRDLKPSNVLVDSDGSPKVLDFGLAKRLGAPADTLATMSRQVVGTLPYLSPEQARGAEIDARSDVYSLGVIFYELLTGQYPYPVAGQMAEVLKHIAETEPIAPSQRWTPQLGIAAGRSRHRSRSFSNLWRGAGSPIDEEVETIVLKCLAKERERRYQSAGEIARDIRHCLAGEAIEAKRASGWYLVQKAVRRYRVHLAAATVFAVTLALTTALPVATILLLTLIIALGITMSAWRHTARQRDRARLAEQRAQGVVQFLRDIFAMANPLSERQACCAVGPRRPAPFYAGQSGEALGVAELLPAAVRWLDELRLDPLLEAEIRHVLGSTLADMGQFDPAIAQLQVAVATRARICGADALESLESRRRLAEALLLRGEKDEALSLAQKAYERLRKAQGPGHALTLAFASLTAQALEKNSRTEEAIGLLRSATEAAVSAGAEPDELFLRRLDLARILTENANRSPESLQITKECMHELAHRPDARRLYVYAADVRAQTLFNLGRFHEAEDASREAVRACSEEFGPDHPLTAYQKIYLARNISEHGALQEALQIADESLECQRRAGGDEHPWTYRAERCVARQLVRLRVDLVRAEALARHAAAGYARLFSPEHEATLYARDAEALSLQGRDQLDQAESILRENARIGAGTIAGWWYARHLESFGLCLAERGKYDDAEEQLLAAWQRVESCIGAASEPARQMAEHLVRLYERMHAGHPQAGYDEQAAQWRAKLRNADGRPEHRSELAAPLEASGAQHHPARENECELLAAEASAAAGDSRATRTSDPLAELGALHVQTRPALGLPRRRQVYARRAAVIGSLALAAWLGFRGLAAWQSQPRPEPARRQKPLADRKQPPNPETTAGAITDHPMVMVGSVFRPEFRTELHKNPSHAEADLRERVRSLAAGDVTARHRTYTALGVTLEIQGKFGEAEEAYKEALAALPDTIESRGVLNTYDKLAGVIAAQDKPVEAERLWTEAITRALAGEVPARLLARLRARYATFLSLQQRFSEAVTQLQTSIAELQQAPDSGAELLAATRELLTDVQRRAADRSPGSRP